MNKQPQKGDYVQVRRRRDDIIMCTFGCVAWRASPEVFGGPVRYYVWHGNQMHQYNSNDHEVTI
jgi:hypothetical protein